MKYAIRRQCHFDCAGFQEPYEREALVVEDLNRINLNRDFEEVPYCCLETKKSLPATTEVYVYEMDEEGTEFLYQTKSISTELVI